MPLDVRTLSREDYWRQLCQHVPLSGRPFADHVEPYRITTEATQAAHASLIDEGYATLPPLVEPLEAARIAELVQTVTASGLPAPFAFVYDPIWRVLQRLAPVMEAFLGPGVSLVPDDFWIWQVDGEHESEGWGWHRDRCRGEGQFDAQGRPLVLTAWIPFTDATPENGCIEVLPRSRDPHVRANPERAIVEPESESFVRALPVSRGAPLAWNMHALHRGRAYGPYARGPRISAGIYVQSADCRMFEHHEIKIGGPLSLADRLGMIASAVLQYAYRYRFGDDLLEACRLWKQLRDLAIARRSARR